MRMNIRTFTFKLIKSISCLSFVFIKSSELSTTFPSDIGVYLDVAVSLFVSIFMCCLY